MPIVLEEFITLVVTLGFGHTELGNRTLVNMLFCFTFVAVFAFPVIVISKHAYLASLEYIQLIVELIKKLVTVGARSSAGPAPIPPPVAPVNGKF